MNIVVILSSVVFLLSLAESGNSNYVGPRQKYDDFDDEKPVYGNPDRVSGEFNLFGTKWKKTDLTWFFKNNPDVSHIPVRKAIARISSALDTWSKASPLTFREVFSESEADIVIFFGDSDHLPGFCSLKFNENILGHAYFPGATPIGGDAHFDLNDPWDFATNPPIDGGESEEIDFETVALHEFGHSLGLEHSDVEEAVMSQSYAGIRRSLSQDDIDAIQKLYRRGVPATPPPTAPENTVPASNLCTPPTEHCAYKGKACDELDEYSGPRSQTRTGIPCQRWDSSTPHAHSHFLPTDSSRGNYCQTGDGENLPWCYTADPKKRWDFCFEECPSPCRIDPSKWYQLVSRESGRVLEMPRPAYGSRPIYGTDLVEENNYNDLNQQFQFERIETDVYYIRNRDTKLYIVGDDLRKGKVFLWEKNGHIGQKWCVEEEDNHCVIKNKQTNEVMTRGKVSGTSKIILQPFKGAHSQQWNLTAA